MAGEMIVSFKKDVQQAIYANQEKFNPDSDDRIDEKELGVLLTEFGAKDKNDLLNCRVKISDSINNSGFFNSGYGSAICGGVSMTSLVLAGNFAKKTLRISAGIGAVVSGVLALAPLISDVIDPRK